MQLMWKLFLKAQTHRKPVNMSSRKLELSNPFQRNASLVEWKYGEQYKIFEARFSYTGRLDWLYCETCEVWTSYLALIGEKTLTEVHCDLSPNCEYAKSIPQFKENTVIHDRTALPTKYAERLQRLLCLANGNTETSNHARVLSMQDFSTKV